MLGVDTNVLLHSLNPSSAGHERARTFLRDVLRDQSKEVAIADLVLVELYVLLRNPTVMARPLTAPKAVEVIRSYWRIPTVCRIEHASVMDRVWKAASRKGFARRRIFDVRLGETLLHHGVTHFATANVKDFQGMGFEKVWNPLASG